MDEIVVVSDPNDITTIRIEDADILEISVSNLDGDGGAGGFEFIQEMPKDIWIITHNLGFRPSVEIFNSGQVEIEGNVINVSVNQTLIQFTTPTSGRARLT